MSPTLYDHFETSLPEIGVRGSPEAVVVTCEQGTGDWFSHRAGIPTASKAKLIVTATGKICTADGRKTYQYRLLAERLTGTVEPDHKTAAMERGTNLEPRARQWYEWQTGRTVQEVGFVYRDAAKGCGCSPDGLCEDRLLEIKCPEHTEMLRMLLKSVGKVDDKDKVPTGYLAQIQFSLWVTGLPFCAFVGYTPEPQIASVVWEVPADPAYHAMLDVAVPIFCAELDEAEQQLRAMAGETDDNA